VQQTLHIRFILFRSFLCKNLRIFFKSLKELTQTDEKIRNRIRARVCVICFDVCGRDARWRQVGAAANATTSNVEHDQHLKRFAR
jgi:hypothetical protein